MSRLVLGLETSCDETSAAVIADGRRILSNVISSQIALHTLYGGVVPEIASRKQPVISNNTLISIRIMIGSREMPRNHCAIIVGIF